MESLGTSLCLSVCFCLVRSSLLLLLLHSSRASDREKFQLMTQEFITANPLAIGLAPPSLSGPGLVTYVAPGMLLLLLLLFFFPSFLPKFSGPQFPTNNEDFINWNRVAGLPTFRKLYAIIPQGLFFFIFFFLFLISFLKVFQRLLTLSILTTSTPQNVSEKAPNRSSSPAPPLLVGKMIFWDMRIFLLVPFVWRWLLFSLLLIW
jgi:hypothetical protein